MALIAFLIDSEEGHLLPSFGLAYALKERGHTIIYLSVRENETRIKEEGFSFREMRDKSHPKKLINIELDSFIREFNPSMVIISAFLGYDALILHYKYKISPVIFTPCLKDSGRNLAARYLNGMVEDPEQASIMIDFLIGIGINITSLQQLTAPLNSFHELVVCPRELEAYQEEIPENVHYLGPMIRLKNKLGGAGILDSIPNEKKIIYASLGSQVAAYGKKATIFFHNIINVMRDDEMKDFHLVIAIGHNTEKKAFIPIPDNVTIYNWAPQIEILKSASIAIIHGGLGTIKECIYYGVPMLIFPLNRDQPMNAKIIQYKNLGITGKFEMITETSLKNNIMAIHGNQLIKESISNMQNIFRFKQDSDYGIDVVEELLK